MHDNLPMEESEEGETYDAPAMGGGGGGGGGGEVVFACVLGWLI